MFTRTSPRRAVARFALIAVALTLLLGAASAQAAPVSLVVDTTTPTLESGPKDSSKLALKFTNVSDEPIVLTPAVVGQQDCKPTLSANQLPSGQTTAVNVELPSACDAGDALKVDITATSRDGSQVFSIDPKGKPAEKPDWEPLWAFAWSLGLAFALVVIVLRAWKPARGLTRSISQPLRYLDKTWKFDDNWLTNVTALSGILTALFSATTAKAFLGDNAEAEVVVATVGAAVAVAYVAVAPVVLLAFKSFEIETNEKEEKVRLDKFSVGGLLAAAVIVLASAIAQIYVVTRVVMDLDLGGFENVVPFVAIAIGFLLFFYSFRSLVDLLHRGTEKPPTPKDPEERAAGTIAQAIVAGGLVDGDQASVATVEQALANVVPDDGAYTERQRSGLI